MRLFFLCLRASPAHSDPVYEKNNQDILRQNKKVSTYTCVPLKLHFTPWQIPTPTQLWEALSHIAITGQRIIHNLTTVYSQVLVYIAELIEATLNEQNCPGFKQQLEDSNILVDSSNPPCYHALPTIRCQKYTLKPLTTLIH